MKLRCLWKRTRERKVGIGWLLKSFMIKNTARKIVKAFKTEQKKFLKRTRKYYEH